MLMYYLNQVAKGKVTLSLAITFVFLLLGTTQFHVPTQGKLLPSASASSPLI